MDEIKSLDAKGINFLMNEEGLRLCPYKDSKGIWTIAVGNTYYADGRKVEEGDKCLTKVEAIALFKTVLTPYELTVYSVTRDDITQNQFNALVCIAYNIGKNGFKNSTLLKRVNANPNDKPGISDAFLMWKNPKELIGRRKREISMYFS